MSVMAVLGEYLFMALVHGVSVSIALSETLVYRRWFCVCVLKSL
jgi:hypothetical protein